MFDDDEFRRHIGRALEEDLTEVKHPMAPLPSAASATAPSSSYPAAGGGIDYAAVFGPPFGGASGPTATTRPPRATANFDTHYPSYLEHDADADGTADDDNNHFSKGVGGFIDITAGQPYHAAAVGSGHHHRAYQPLSSSSAPHGSTSSNNRFAFGGAAGGGGGIGDASRPLSTSAAPWDPYGSAGGSMPSHPPTMQSTGGPFGPRSLHHASSSDTTTGTTSGTGATQQPPKIPAVHTSSAAPRRPDSNSGTSSRSRNVTTSGPSAGGVGAQSTTPPSKASQSRRAVGGGADGPSSYNGANITRGGDDGGAFNPMIDDRSTTPPMAGGSFNAASLGGFDVTGGGGSGERSGTAGRVGTPPGDNEPQAEVSKTVHVQYIPVTLTEKEFGDFLRDCGNIVRVRVCGNSKKDHNWTYGFVEFDTEEAAVRLIQRDGHRIGSFRLRCSHAKAPIADRTSQDASRNNFHVCAFGVVHPQRTLKDTILAYTTHASESANAAAGSTGGATPAVVVGGGAGSLGISIGSGGATGSSSGNATVTVGSGSATSLGGAGGSNNVISTLLKMTRNAAPPQPQSGMGSHPHDGGHTPTVVVGGGAAIAPAQSTARSPSAFPGFTSVGAEQQYSEALSAALSKGVLFLRERNQSHFYSAMGSAMQALDIATKQAALSAPHHHSASTAASRSAGGTGAELLSFPHLATGRDPQLCAKLTLVALHLAHGSVAEAVQHAFPVLQHAAALPMAPIISASPIVASSVGMGSAAAYDDATGSAMILYLNQLAELGVMLEATAPIVARMALHLSQLRASLLKLEGHAALDDALLKSLTDPASVLGPRLLSEAAATSPAVGAMAVKAALIDTAVVSTVKGATSAAAFTPGLSSPAAMVAAGAAAAHFIRHHASQPAFLTPSLTFFRATMRE